MLREATNLQFERVPGSGAHEELKGDLDVPKTNNLIKWSKKLLIQAERGNQEPLLFFKYNRSPVFVVTGEPPEETKEYMFICFLQCFVLLAEEWLKKEKVEFISGI